ncbi:Transglutaminase-like superfamily protein [Lacunisphaera limnophila]|uniref:Transglutaminase-like superfamily protein n=1 Tax=Lacunisphaera limnophila TaxID=1838286 RepID=A0A1D8AR43_9BACT|nr:transglutaminase family protein [Lacunisphaera limnophila]AOS43355.1 Transglutaminase-like superfamily protein [Lacunisphaera limnophila]
MAIHVALNHRTSYKYDRPVTLGPQVIRLRPAPHCRTPILSYSLKLKPAKGHFLNWQQDAFGNYLARVVYPEKVTEFSVEVDVVAEMSVYNPFDFFLEPYAEKFPFTYEKKLATELAPFLRKNARKPKFGAFVAGIDLKPQRTIDFLVALNSAVNRLVSYVIRLEPGVQTPEKTLTLGSGSCRDSAWLLVNALRHCGLAARFVSGYLIQLKADQKSLDGPSGAETDFTDLHAWCEVYLPGAGWIGLDPTSGLLAGEGHIPLACSPEPSSAAAISGGVDECETEFDFAMAVTRVHESPRVTKPYTEEQWTKIEALGHQIDAELTKNDVRLTMGGEPTFISLDDPDGPEWNFVAASHRKRVLSGQLIKRLRTKFAPGALLHYGQGKWYPGEQLPRWALSAYWRKDGVPIWHDDSLIADESKNYGHGPKEAKELASRLARTLGVNPAHLIPGYEDAFYYTWKERRLPSNVTPEKTNLKDKLERERIARIFQEGLGTVVGYALPIKRATVGNQTGWMSGSWFLRDDETLWLIPGDSCMGLRLPLDSVPWVADKDYPWNWQQDPSATLGALPKETPHDRRRLAALRAGQRILSGGGAALPAGYGPGQRAQDPENLPPLPPPNLDPNRRPQPGESAPWIIRTALCVQPRDGRLHVFMPPVSTTEDYLDLISGIEATVTEMGVPVIIEGETPPKDPRLNKLAVTPDPGVIEVNMHPSKTWDELVERTTVLYEEARQTRLGTEKFMLDGRHSGTGGGNHIIIGGETPGDSPVLRRPDLLRSLLAYWQNHPSLSWLFSGLFIGPTSQAPRIDEARNDALYELEVAFKEMDRQLGTFNSVPPWMVDRLFRNLLTDATGNTHRSEFSIDKLYAPEGPTGRLGLVEMRAFEMPPHARMSLAQHLLLRGLVNKFWKEPYKNGLVRWGTDIHDRWMLPHFNKTDFNEVIRDLRLDGQPFEAGWFDPHFEFRFPRVGEFSVRDVKVELRAALEPWHVLGEEPGPGGTVRYVDSSLERLQVKATGLTGDRFVLTANGHRVPLHPTGVNGEGVAGVRYRAWQPPECLHPTIPSHAPVVFDLVDTWNKRSLGGCTYYVAHPGGRSYETFPVNSYEAESRRLARFQGIGHTPGGMRPAIPASTSRELPFTLDLRNP